MEHCKDHDCLVSDVQAIRHDTGKTLKLVEIHNAKHEARDKMLGQIGSVVKIISIVVGSLVAVGSVVWAAFGGG